MAEFRFEREILREEENDENRRIRKSTKIAYTSNGFWTTLALLIIYFRDAILS